MLRNKIAFLAMVPALALGYAACASDVGTNEAEDVQEAQEASIKPNPALIGTFRSAERQVGHIETLALKTNSTYHREVTVECFAAPCYPIGDDGRYNVWVSGRDKILALHARDGVENYLMTLNGNELMLTKLAIPFQGWMTLYKTTDEAWCDVERDCSLQNLPVPVCGARWYCVDNVCERPCRPLPDSE